MHAEENPVEAEAFIRRAHAANEAANPRDPGMHASDLIYCTRKAWYARQPGAVKPEPSAREMALWLTGHGHHQMLQMQDRESADLKTILPLPCRVGPTPHTHLITMNLDFFDRSDNVPVEIKSTRKSSTCKIHEISWYVEQVMIYVLWWGVPTPTPDGEIFAARLHVLFLNGDYRENRTPVLRTWDLVSTKAELRAWLIELGTRIHAITGPVMPTPERYEWECDYCPYSATRGGPCDQPVLAKGRGGDKLGIKRTGFFDLTTQPTFPPPVPEEVPEDGDNADS